MSGSLSNTRDPGNNGFIHQEFPCRIDHYNAILHLRTVPNKIPNDSYFMYLKTNYYLMTREQRPIYNITGIPVQVCFQVNVYFYNVDLHAPPLTQCRPDFRKAFKKDNYLVIFWKDLDNILDLGDSKIHSLLKMITQPFLWIPDRDTSRLNLSRGVIEAFLLMYTRCILKG